MNRLLTLTITALLFAGGGAAATETAADPGFVTADNPLYAVDRAIDTGLVQLGVKDLGDVAHERASEALVAAEANDTAALDRALTAVNETVAVANGLRDGVGLGKAEAVLTDVHDRVPEAAQSGVQTAIDNVIQATNRFPTDLPESGDGMPGRGGV